MKKKLSFVLVLALCAALLCISAWAAGETPSTADDTISINSAEELENFRDAVNSGNSFEGKTVVLGDNIDLNNEQWTPIGSYSDKPFSGIFDGGGHTISGLHVSGEYGYAGLFGVVGEDGTVKNLTVKGDITNKGKFTGGVIGYNLGTVENCAFTGTVNGGGEPNGPAGTEVGNYTGGVAGINYGTIKNCRNDGDVTGNDKGTGAQSHTGGVVGENSNIVADCCNTGAVTGIGDDSYYKYTYAGGVAGYNIHYDEGSGSGTITNCRNSGAVKSEGYYVRAGGVAGYSTSGPEKIATITNCYNTGTVTSTVTGNSRTGGVEGENDSKVMNCYNTGTVSNSGGTGNCIGGVAGYNNTGTVENCYNTGEVNGNFGSAVGENGSLGTATYCYYLTADGSTSTDAAALTAEEFKDQDSFPDWDFTDVWTISSVLGRPVLVDNREADGTAEAPYEIGTAEELAAFRDKVNGSNGTAQNDAHAVLTADIDLSEVHGEESGSWTPIGSDDQQYTGTFDGNGHTVSGLCVSGEYDYAGLFGVVGKGGTVKNLTVKGSVTGSDGDGSDVFNLTYTYTGGVAGQNHGTVADCSFTGTVTVGDGFTYAGGVVGQNHGTVEDCSFNGTVTAKDNTGNESYIGGVVGENYGAVADCCNTGAVIGSYSNATSYGFNPTGGVVGCNNNEGGSSIIKNCCNTGTVTGAGDRSLTGGVVGCNAGGTVTNCRNSGDVTGTVTSNTGDSRTGGVAGESTGGTIENCYNTGNVNSTAGSTGDGYPGAGIGEDKGTAGTVESKTEEEFATGAVANLLGDAYGQTLGKDNFPKLIAFDPDVPRVYRVTFDFNDGDVTPDQVSYTNGTVTLPAEPSAAGWRDGAGTLHEAGSTVTVTADVTYTAVWAQINIPDTYEIELIVSEGGEAKTSLSNASAGTTITVTAVPDEGYVLSCITVDGERISGMSFKMPAHDVTVRVYFTDGTAAFTDVSRGDWFYEYVDYVAANGLMEGVSASEFAPDANMTRAMVWAVLARMDGEEISGANWQSAARAWAMESGVSDGTDPDGLVTREQLAAMLHRFAGEPATAANLEGFTDAASVSAWAVDAMSWCVEQGIITGVTDTALSPQSTATRAQCAAMLMRFELR